MFIGKTYILFKYRVLRDVRLVYAPPRAIGEFGGESDNWYGQGTRGISHFYEHTLHLTDHQLPIQKRTFRTHQRDF
jgi:hypothetical protein